jgi:hypothetical protein
MIGQEPPKREPNAGLIPTLAALPPALERRILAFRSRYLGNPGQWACRTKA